MLTVEELRKVKTGTLVRNNQGLWFLVEYEYGTYEIDLIIAMTRKRYFSDLLDEPKMVKGYKIKDTITLEKKVINLYDEDIDYVKKQITEEEIQNNLLKLKLYGEKI